MGSAKKTVKPSKTEPLETESANIALHPTRPSRVRKTETRDQKRAGQAEAKSVASANAKHAALTDSSKKVEESWISQAAAARLDGKGGLATRAQAGKSTSKKAVAAIPHETLVKVGSGENATKAAQAAIESRAKDSVGPSREFSSACAASMARAAEPCGELTHDGSSPEAVDRTLSWQRIGRAATPGRAAASENLNPGADEQKIVTKKTEKRVSVESAADIKILASAPATDAILKAPSKPAAGADLAINSRLKPSEAKSGDKAAPAVGKSGKGSSAPRPGFKPNEFIVYPAHGVGQIVAIEEQVVAGFKLELFVISFVKDKMILKVPTPKVASVGMRKLAEADVVKKALDTLAGRARIKRTMWSRRAQEYEAKINSGDLISIAEVVRDLYRSDSQPEQSYSERQLYEAALDRMAREVVIVQKLTETESLRTIEAQLQKGPRRGKAEESDADEADAEIEEAA
jgi:CarD family transcriptional regulator